LAPTHDPHAHAAGGEPGPSRVVFRHAAASVVGLSRRDSDASSIALRYSFWLEGWGYSAATPVIDFRPVWEHLGAVGPHCSRPATQGISPKHCT
jgi:hypothetical protein